MKLIVSILVVLSLSTSSWAQSDNSGVIGGCDKCDQRNLITTLVLGFGFAFTAVTVQLAKDFSPSSRGSSGRRSDDEQVIDEVAEFLADSEPPSEYLRLVFDQVREQTNLNLSDVEIAHSILGAI